MSRKQCGLMILVAFLSGLVGGSIVAKFPSTESAFAQNESGSINQPKIHAKTIIAEEFFIQDWRGSDPLEGEISIPRIMITTKPDGRPKMIMQDSHGTPRVSIGLGDSNEATLAIYNENGTKKAILTEGLSDGGKTPGTSLAFLDDQGNVRAHLGVGANNDPFIALTDPPAESNNSARRIRLSVNQKDAAAISLYGTTPTPRAELRTDSEDTCLTLRDPNGEIRTELGNTALAFGKDGSLEKSSAGAFSVENRSPASLVLYDKAGKVIWTAP